jgi:hypothetical protein
MKLYGEAQKGAGRRTKAQFLASIHKESIIISNT